MLSPCTLVKQRPDLLDCFRPLMCSLPPCSVLSAPAAGPGGLQDGSQPSVSLQPRQSHPLPAVGVSETFGHPGAGRTHFTPLQGRYNLQVTTTSTCDSPKNILMRFINDDYLVCFRVLPVRPEEPQTEAGFKQAAVAGHHRAPPTGLHAADSRGPADRRQPQSVQSCGQLPQQSCRLRGLQESGALNRPLGSL